MAQSGWGPETSLERNAAEHAPRRSGLVSGARFLFRLILDFIYPPLCVLCEALLSENEELVCAHCLALLPRHDDPQVASEQLAASLSEPAYFASSIALFPYHDAIQTLIHMLKYRGYKALAKPLAHELALILPDCELPSNPLIIPVPLHKRRLRERGFNQSFLLAAELSRHCGWPMRPELLQRIRATIPQARLSRAQRSSNLAGAFVVPDSETVNERDVLLVDDVLTTGHTLNECARTLRSAGAASVHVVTLVRVQAGRF
jgi:ComF family protein